MGGEADLPTRLVGLLFDPAAPPLVQLVLPDGCTAKHAFLLLADVYVRGLSRLRAGAGSAGGQGLALDDVTPDDLSTARACMLRAGVEPRVAVYSLPATAHGPALDLQTGVLALPDDGLPLEAYSVTLHTRRAVYELRFALPRRQDRCRRLQGAVGV